MYRTPISSSLKYVDCEKSTMGSKSHMKQMGSQLQPNDAAFSVVNFQTREQPQLQRNSVAFLVGCPIWEVLGSSAHIRQSDPQLQQKNAAFSVD